MQPSHPHQFDRKDVERTIVSMIAKNTGISSNKIGLDTDLIADLGIAGDDAQELFQEILKSYPIDLSGSDLGARFGGEAILPWQIPILIFKIIYYPVQRWILGKSPREIMGPGVLVREVVDSAMAGKWMPAIDAPKKMTA